MVFPFVVCITHVFAKVILATVRTVTVGTLESATRPVCLKVTLEVTRGSEGHLADGAGCFTVRYEGSPAGHVVVVVVDDGAGRVRHAKSGTIKLWEVFAYASSCLPLEGISRLSTHRAPGKKRDSHSTRKGIGALAVTLCTPEHL